MFSLKSRLAIVAAALLIIVLVPACAPSADPHSLGTYPVDQTFTDFYREFGGEDTLGPAISASFTNQGVTYQYVLAGLMVYDPNQIPLKRFHFSRIAYTEWKIQGMVEPVPSDSDQHYVNGHPIWEEIWSFYDQYGPDIIGMPLTGVSANDMKQRYEQYFEGIGFFRNYADPPGKIQLMPYGSWMCGSNCQYQSEDTTPPIASYSREFSATEQLFLQTAERLGYGFCGAPLISPRLGSDGNYQMVFENLVMYIDASDGNQVKLRPLPSWLGVHSEAPKAAEQADWLSFYATQDDLGYNVPKTFIEYINNHGTAAYSGNPITEYRNLADEGYSQCFRNICLEYHPYAPKELQIRPHALGYDYRAASLKINTPGPAFAEALQIDAWEDYPLIASGGRQVIHIEVRRNEAPVSGITFSLAIKQPDGITKTYELDATGNDGRTSIELEPIEGPNGAIIQYKVCVIASASPQVCFTRSYSIWEQ